jgi:hypothetical protein
LVICGRNRNDGDGIARKDFGAICINDDRPMVVPTLDGDQSQRRKDRIKVIEKVFTIGDQDVSFARVQIRHAG